MRALIIASIIIVIVLIIILYGRIRKRKKYEKNMVIKAQDKMREEALDRRILNEKAEVKSLKEASEKPFEVNYSAPQGDKKTGNHFMLQIEEKNELSIRKFMLDPAAGISIGSAKDNSIVISDAGVEKKQCEIGFQEEKLYIRNFGKTETVCLSRKGKKLNVDQRKVELKNNDIVFVGKIRLKLEYIFAGEDHK